MILLAFASCGDDGGGAQGQRGAGGAPGDRKSAAAVPVKVEPVLRRDISDYILANTTLEAFQWVDVRSRASGQIVEVLKEEGDPVREGDVVARLQAALERVDLAERQVDVAARLAAAEKERLDLGLSTPLPVVEARDQHRKAQLDRLRATVDAQTAAITVAHLTGDLLPRCSELVAGR